MKTNTLFVVITSLLVGGGIGYAIHTKTPEAETPVIMNHSMMETNNGMELMIMDMTDRMNGKSGDELDRIFLEDMIVHHQGAVDMAIIIKENTKRPELKNFAQEIIDVQDQEINMMKEWLAKWFLSENIS